MEKYLIAEFEKHGREPVICQMGDKSLICLSLTGGETEPANDNFVGIARSYDRGKTWTKVEKLFSHETRGVWCPEVFADCGVPFAALLTYDADMLYMELNNFISYTYDNGKTWTDPVSFCGITGRSTLRRGFILSNGDMFFPSYWQETVGETGFTTGDVTVPWNKERKNHGKLFRCGAVISSDGGKTWQQYGYITLGDENIWEPNATELENGHIIMYGRNNSGYLAISESSDYGRTWTEPRISDIPNSDTKVTVLKINGKIYMINNFVAEAKWEGRRNLCIAESTDGYNFKIIANVEDENELVFYPHAFADYEERILYVAYENMKQHYLKKFSFDELGIE